MKISKIKNQINNKLIKPYEDINNIIKKKKYNNKWK